MNYLSKNIKHLREQKNLSQPELADRLGVKRDNIAGFERGSAPKIDLLPQIAAIFEVDIADLINIDLTKQAVPLSRAQPGHSIEKFQATKAASHKEFVRTNDRIVDFQTIPLYSFEAAASLKQLFNNTQNVLDYIHIPNLPKCDGAVHISGDSMYPLLKSGDIVAYKQIHDIPNGIFWGEMYLLSVVIDEEDFTLVKYIQKSELGEEYIKLVSQNQHHAPKDVLLKSVRALGLIKASIRINSMS